MNGDYEIAYQREVWYKFWRKNDLTYIQIPDTNVYVFTSIFAPTALKKLVAHHWRWKNPQNGKWETADRIGYQITGGRDNGYRGFTFKRNIREGEWRVDVITNEGHVIGIVRFDVVMGQVTDDLQLESKIF